MKRYAVMTSGGDSPGMNAAIRAFTRKAIHDGNKVMGIWGGYEGLLNEDITELNNRSVGNVIQQGGTFLKTSRSERFRKEPGQKKAAEILEKQKIDALCVIGGDGSFRGLAALSKFYGGQMIGVPGTIDNDIPGTEYTIGFDTAVHTAVWAIDKIRDTASSHARMIFVEVMGRHSGQIALHVALAAGAEDVLIPEEKTDVPAFIKRLEKGRKLGKRFGIVVVAEGDDAGGAFEIAEEVTKETGLTIKVSVLGYIQRGGPPTAADRIYGSRMGEAAVRFIQNDHNLVFTALRAGHIQPAYLTEATSGKRSVDPEMVKLVRVIGS